jgi:hypothetical protein
MTLIQENPPQKPRAVSPDWHWHIPGPTKGVPVLRFLVSEWLVADLPLSIAILCVGLVLVPF